MLGIGEIIYFCLLFVALFISIARRKFLPWYFIYFRILLSFSILFDLGGFILKFYHYPRYWVYHLYRPLDYIFFACLFFFEIKTEAEKKIIKYFSSIGNHIISHHAKIEVKTPLVHGEIKKRNLCMGRFDESK